MFLIHDRWHLHGSQRTCCRRHGRNNERDASHIGDRFAEAVGIVAYRHHFKLARYGFVLQVTGIKLSNLLDLLKLIVVHHGQGYRVANPG